VSAPGPGSGLDRARAAAASRLGAAAPLPFVALAAILVALIVFTPVLLASGPSPLEVQAILGVYRAPGSATTSFEIHGYDPDVPYRFLNLSVGTGFAWTGACPTGPLTWSYTNTTNQTATTLASSSAPLVVNASAVYGQGSGRTVYAGELAIEVTNQNTSSETLVFVVCPSTPTLPTPSPWTVSLTGADPIPLVNYGAGGPP